MRREKIIVRQHFGLGDILFISPIVRKLDYDIIWPVESHYIWIKDYILQDNIAFIDVNEYLSGDKHLGLQHVDFLNAEHILKNMGHAITDCMTAKYIYADHDLNDWKTLHWRRDVSKEESLLKHLGLEDGAPFNLINLNFAEPRLGYKIDVTLNNGYKNIYMDYINGYTLLDWAGVIEKSTEFHTVCTSTIFMVEFLNCSRTAMHLYPRYGVEKNLDHVRPIISERWICHE